MWSLNRESANTSLRNNLIQSFYQCLNTYTHFYDNSTIWIGLKDYYYYYYLLIESFSHQCYLMVFHWSLSDWNCSQVSRTLFSILTVLNNAVVWMISTRPTSKSSSPFNSPLVTVPKAPITIDIIVTFIFHSFLIPCKVKVLIRPFTFFQFYSVVSRDSKVDNFASSLFFCW